MQIGGVTLSWGASQPPTLKKPGTISVGLVIDDCVMVMIRPSMASPQGHLAASWEAVDTGQRATYHIQISPYGANLDKRCAEGGGLNGGGPAPNVDMNKAVDRLAGNRRAE